NQGGQLGGNASNLNVTATGIVNNQDGALIHTGSGDMRISGASVNNTRGQLITNRGLTLTSAGTVTNDAGVIQAAQATITAGQLTNQALNNQGGKILTSQGDLTVTGSVNSQGSDSVIQSANDLTVNGGTITNGNGAMLSAAKALTVNADVLNNDKALIVANQAMAINAGSTTNSGSIGSVNDAVTIAGGSLTNTASGSIQAAKAITITQGNVANQGQIASNDALNVTGSGAIDNHSGILAGSNVALTAQTLNNNAGFISQSATDGSLTITTQGLLDNQYTKSSDATKPLGILANGTASIHAGDVNNYNGRINADTMTLTSTGSSVNNKAGEIAAKQALTVNAGNANLTNQTGQLMGHTTSVTAAVVDNSNHGLVLANQDLTVNAGTISNSDTKQAPDAILSQGLVAGSDATLTAAVIDNSNGQVVAGNAATLNVSQTLNNANGRIESNHVQVNGSANVDNTSGLIKGHEQVGLTAKSLTNTGGQLRSPTLNLALTDSFTHGTTDKLEADNLSLTTQGEFINQGKLAAAKRLAVTAQTIDNQKDASLESGDLTELNATNNIQNRGLINGTKTYLAAGNTLNNLSYGRIYGDYVAIKANTLNNTPEGYGTPAPVIAARQQLDIGVKQLNNNPNPDRAGKFNSDFNGQAQIISNGDLNIGGDLDANHMATGKADSVNNRGAIIESDGHMTITASVLRNENADWQVSRTETARENKIVEYAANTSSQKYTKDEVDWDDDGEDMYVKATGQKIGEDYNEFHFDKVMIKDIVVASDPARLVAGKNLIIHGDDLTNQKSQINAGAGYQQLGDMVQNDMTSNLGYEVKRVENGKYYWRWIDACGLFGSKHCKELDYKGTYQPADEVISSFNLPILNAQINTNPIALTSEPKVQVDALNQAVTALNTLKQSTQSASNQTGSTNNDTASKQDALKLLADFAKANPDNLTPDQQKQLSDILAAQKDGKGVSQAQLNGLIDSLNSTIKSQYTEEVRTTGNGPTLPNSSLYNIDPNNPNGYLVETDPAFANYKKWLSSDYMMQRLGLDPSNMHKRLGDGYYEQGLIRDQVMTLTGRRFLGDYTTDDAMYQALMDNGVATAKAINLRPGIALTAEQMAQLTTDIVWLVEQTITLKDGSKQTVLVPKVYVRSKVGDLKGDSSLIAARNMDMQFTGDLSNQGNIVAHNGLHIQANNLNNQNGGVIQGNFVQINTKNDLNNLGATLKANSAMTIDVGGKLNNSSTTYHTESKLGQSNAWRTGIDQVGQIYVGDGLKGKTDDNGRPLTTLSIDVGGNATFNAGQLINQGGTTRLIAQGDVALNAVNTGYQANAIGDSNNYYKVGQTQDVGSSLQSLGSTAIISEKGSITGMAANIASADGMTYLKAAKDIAFNEGRATSNLETAVKTTEKSLLSRKTTQDRYSRTSDEAIQSNLEGNTVVMDAGRNIHLTATRAVSDSGTALTAGHDVTIDAAQNRYRESSSHNEKKSGIFGANSGIGFTIGSQKQSMDNQRNVVNHTGSTVGAIDGNVVINAGNHYQQTASDVVAGMGTDTGKGIIDSNRGNIATTAKSADIVNATATEDSQSQQKFKQTGLSVSVSNGLVDQYNSINGLVKAGENADSDRMKAMAGISAGLKAQNAILIFKK
ncbi:adhesin HecA family 20-residue repeat (two copies) (3 repeats), partial [Enhydrobacter aerosaccus SK60]